MSFLSWYPFLFDFEGTSKGRPAILGGPFARKDAQLHGSLLGQVTGALAKFSEFRKELPSCSLVSPNKQLPPSHQHQAFYAQTNNQKSWGFPPPTNTSLLSMPGLQEFRGCKQMLEANEHSTSIRKFTNNFDILPIGQRSTGFGIAFYK